jgi:hypothetical protein
MDERAIERIKRLHHTRIINWAKQVDNYSLMLTEADTIPRVAELDELERFVVKKNKIWLGTAVNDFQPGILGLALGDRACRNFSIIVRSTSVTGNVIFILQIDNQFIPVYSRWKPNYL